MRFSRLLVVPALALICLAGASIRSEAQISINIGVAPVCPYGYYNYAPYSCAPFGYYGPQWFTGGIFIGAGPWFHGPVGFHGYVNTYYDPRFGYHGPYPARGEHADWGRHRGWEKQFHGNEYREEHHDNGNHYGEYKNKYAHDNGHGEGHGNGHGNGHDEKHGNGHGKGHDK